ncbi:Zinc finger bed domain-containing protein 4 [Plakobranchus ocellatus]|uniref:Zinc finger bed domain-containing protein 4 n=1 Tax=Plakobranchus ocellatus TaxID=259542 RepID=A0AAV4DYU5_9GAST|nr:Zinc finger bed domain-containing protein 4 [Plakobranchus ocellatus]
MDPRCEIVPRKKLTLHLLPGKYNDEKMKLFRELEDVDYIYVHHHRLLDFTANGGLHNCHGPLRLRSTVLSTTVVEGSHTSEKLSSALKQVFEAWVISKKVTTIVTDNSANVKAAVEILKVRHQPCFAHTLNLTVKDAIRRTENVFNAKNQVKNIVTFFHHSTLANNALKEAHKTSQTQPRKLKQDVETRWNSTYDMLQSSSCGKLKERVSSIAVPQPEEADEAIAGPTLPKKPSLLWAKFDAHAQNKKQIATQRHTAAEMEIRRHLETPLIPRDANPLDWWKDYSLTNPRMARITKNVLAIPLPATSVLSERLFSKAGELISCRRTTLKSKHIDMILFLNNIRE